MNERVVQFPGGRRAESGLPDGGPAHKGLPLDPAIPGSSTHNKDEKDNRVFDKGKDESIYRTDNADDQLTHRERGHEFKDENADKHNSTGAWGTGEWDSSSKTKYPYRDGIPNTVSASRAIACRVLGRWAKATGYE